MAIKPALGSIIPKSLAGRGRGGVGTQPAPFLTFTDHQVAVSCTFVTTLRSALWKMQPAYQFAPLNLLNKINQLIVCCYGYRM